MKRNSGNCPALKKTPVFLIMTTMLISSVLILGGTSTAAAQTVIKTINVTPGPVAAGANPETNKVYVATYDGKVEVIDGSTDTVEKTISVGHENFGIAVNPNTNKIYVADSGNTDQSWKGSALHVIDGSSDTLIKSIPFGSKGTGIVCANIKTNRIYVSDWGGRLWMLDGATDTVIKETTGISDYYGIYSIDVNSDTNTVYATGNRCKYVYAVDGTTLERKKKIEIEEGQQPSIRVNPETNRIYAYVCGFEYEKADSVAVINGNNNSLIDTISLGENPGEWLELRGPNFMGVNPTVNHVYVSNNGSDEVFVIDGSTNQVLGTVPVGNLPTGIGVNPTTSKAYVANFYGRSVTVINDPLPGGGPTWYLAEGSTAWGFECFVTIENPNDTAVNCDVTYMTTGGEVAGPTVNMPAKSQATVNPFETLGNQDFSTKVECKEGERIAVDRSMLWTSTSDWPEAHCSIGVTAPAETWYLAEGSSAWGFECWLLIQNPQNQAATCQVTYMTEDAGAQTFEKTVPANSRKSFNIADDIGSKDASIKVESNVAVIPERAMYRNNRREGHDSIGTTTPTKNYYLAEGAVGYESGFTTYVLIQNPNATPADVTVTYMTANGPVEQSPFQMQANSRWTIRVNDVLPDGTDFSTAITGTQPIIAERSMYWYGNPNSGEVCHDSIGMSAPHLDFYLPGGGTTNYWETWTLVQNPNDSDVTVEISYLMPDGQNNVVWQETVGSNSRRSFSMADKVPDGSAAVMVRSLDPSKKIMVERAMYWYGRNAGTSTIGGYSD